MIWEFDENKTAVINPSSIFSKSENMPKIAISCFSGKLFEEILKNFPHKEVGECGGCNERWKIYKINYKGKDIALYMSRVGAPACVVNYEETLEQGVEKLVLFGTCGVLDKNIGDCSVIIPTYAVREEGTSYHYAPVSDEIKVNSDEHMEIFENILKSHNYTYTKGKTWTTDAIYRETPQKVQKRKEQGCICVEMECSAMAAAAKFREKEFFQFLYAADNLDAVEWDKRSLGCEEKLSDKMKIAILALEMAINI